MNVRERFRFYRLVIQDIIEHIEQVFIAEQSWLNAGTVDFIGKLPMQILQNINRRVEWSLKLVGDAR